MADRGRVDLRLATQILLLQVVIVTLTLFTAFALFAEFNRHRLSIQYEIRALDIARVVASAPAVRANISPYDAAPDTPTRALIDELASVRCRASQHSSSGVRTCCSW
jgi:two-component system CitB family sensor kinase